MGHNKSKLFLVLHLTLSFHMKSFKLFRIQFTHFAHIAFVFFAFGVRQSLCCVNFITSFTLVEKEEEEAQGMKNGTVRFASSFGSRVLYGWTRFCVYERVSAFVVNAHSQRMFVLLRIEIVFNSFSYFNFQTSAVRVIWLNFLIKSSIYLKSWKKAFFVFFLLWVKAVVQIQPNTCLQAFQCKERSVRQA